MKKLKFYPVLLLLSFTACQKVINVDLNSTSPAIVIVGEVSDQPGPYSVTLSQTVNFSQSNKFPPVDGAFITISDNAGNCDTLSETPTPGTYQTKKISGVVGRTYFLTVKANGQTYTATSTMPQVVTFDSVGIVSFPGLNKPSLYPRADFQDPPGIANYYRFVVTLNGRKQHNIFDASDNHSDGKYTKSLMRLDSSLVSGDTVSVEMQCIDKGAYTYFDTFNLASGSTMVTPYNPISNISNNALGYFSAHTSRYKGIKTP